MQTSVPLPFAVNLRPSASVTLDNPDDTSDGTPILHAATYLVHVTTSEELSEPPQLRYNFNDDSNNRAVSLTGSGTSFQGYLIIPNDNAERVGSFSVQLVDQSGLSGTEVTSGKLFLTDSKPPLAPSVPELEQVRSGIQLTWYDDEDVAHYKIFRNTQSSVTRADYYTKADEKEFIDKDVDEGSTYYYRIAAVDHAGNEGELSPERFLAVDVNSREPLQKKLPSSLTGAVKKKMNDLDKDILDVDAAILEYSMTTDPDKIRAIEYFDLIKKAQTAKAVLTELKSQCDGFLVLNLQEQDLNSRLATIELNEKKAVQSVVNKIILLEKADFVQPVETSSIYEATTQLLQGKVLSSNERTSYESTMVGLNTQARIMTSIVQVEMYYLGSERKDVQSIVKKKVTLQSPLSNGVVVEIIPKGAASSANDVLSQEQFTVLKDDPIIQWRRSGVSFDLAYHFSGKRDVASLKLARSIILEEPVISPDSTAPLINNSMNNSMTGLATDASATTGKMGILGYSMNTILVFLGIVCVLGLAIYYFFFMKSEEAFEEVSSGERPASRRIVQRDFGARERDVVSQGQEEDTSVEVTFQKKAPKGVIQKHTQYHSKQYPQQYVQQNIPPESSVLGESDSRNEYNQPLRKEYSSLKQLLATAHVHLENLEFQPAYGYYLTVLDLMNGLDVGTKADIEAPLESLYIKLQVLRLVQEAHAAVDARNPGRLYDVLSKLESAFVVLKPNSKLGKHVSLSIGYFRGVAKGTKDLYSSYDTDIQ
jgi:hypothetical protein